MTRAASSGERARRAARRGQHLGALVEPDHRDAVAAHEIARDHPGPGRHVEDPLAGAGVERRHHRRPPARVLAEAQRGADAVVVARQAGEQRERLPLARAGCAGLAGCSPGRTSGGLGGRVCGAFANHAGLPGSGKIARPAWTFRPSG